MVNGGGGGAGCLNRCQGVRALRQETVGDVLSPAA